MFAISNIKFSVVFSLPDNWKYLLSIITNNRKKKLKISGNIVSVKDKYCMCFFMKKNKTVHINVTGVKTILEIFEFFKFFACHYFCYDTKLLSLKIDNYTASVNLNKKIDLLLLRKKFYNISKYNPDTFAGLFLKFEEGTFIIFKNGKINVLGCKSVSNIEKLWKERIVLITTLI
jgi:hypothetical protein